MTLHALKVMPLEPNKRLQILLLLSTEDDRCALCGLHISTSNKLYKGLKITKKLSPLSVRQILKTSCPWILGLDEHQYQNQ